MDVFGGPYFRINKFLLTCLGQWPYQKSLHKRIIKTAMAFFVASVIWPEVLYVMAVWGDMDFVMESASAIAVEFATTLKFLNFAYNTGKIKQLMDRIQGDWNAYLSSGSQLTILRRYADEGRRLTEFYSAYMYASLASYVIFPLLPKILGSFIDFDETWPAIPFPIKYGDLDTDKYYIPMMLHSDCVAILIITTVVAMDTTYFVYVQHACGIFAAIGYRLQRLMETHAVEGLEGLSSERREEATYREIRSCAKLHSGAIEFADAIESIYVVVYFFVIGLSVFCMSAAGYQTLTNLEKPTEAFRFGTFTMAQVAHIFFLSWPGQKMIDHSQRIHQWVYSAPWFQTSARSRRLLMIMMLRSVKPCKITAGKFFDMSFPSFSMVVRTAVSYFTVLTSFR